MEGRSASVLGTNSLRGLLAASFRLKRDRKKSIKIHAIEGINKKKEFLLVMKCFSQHFKDIGALLVVFQKRLGEEGQLSDLLHLKEKRKVLDDKV